ncbi:FAD-dependent oxidoreductase [bacterium]|nr:FAD-dependent oxidoreductase [bacterium]
MNENKPLEIVIIGLGVGGLYASKSALNFNRNCHVTIIEKRDFDQFSPCGLPYVIEGVVDGFDALKYDVPEFGKKLTKLLHHEAVYVDKKRKTVKAVDLSALDESLIHDKSDKDKYEISMRDDDGRENNYVEDNKWDSSGHLSGIKEIKYDSLIIATGSSPINLSIPGAGEFYGKGMYFVSDIENSGALLEAAMSSNGKRAVVVGGGAMGLEVATGLRKLGLDVAVTKRTPHPFPKNLDPVMGKLIIDHLEGLGIRTLFGKGIDRINGHERVESVEIAGETIDCDIVVMAAGMRGNTRLAEQIGAKMDKGFVLADKRMETSVKDVYAIGDLVRTYSRIDGTPATMQLATAAYRQGITAGINAAGGNSVYPGALNTFLTVIGGLEIASTGYTQQTATDLGYDAKAISTIREIRPHYMPDAHQINIRVVCDARDGRMLGAQAVGKEGAAWRINLFALAIHGGMTLYDIMDAELSYNPPVSQMYDPIAQIAEIGLKRLGLPPKSL